MGKETHALTTISTWPRTLPPGHLRTSGVGATNSAVSDEELMSNVRALRAAGLSPKGIARRLGVRPAVIADLVRTIAAESATDRERIDCSINAGWSAGLTISGQPEWSDPGGESQADGLVSVLVARGRRHRRDLTVCVYLLDVYCLGVKNALGPERLDDVSLQRFTRQIFSGYGEPPIPAPIELARDLVFGAADYARALGFDPHPDFEAAREHLGAWSGPSAITFGRNGKPTYVQGPHDNPRHIIRTLRRAVGRRGFDYTVEAELSQLPMTG